MAPRSSGGVEPGGARRPPGVAQAEEIVAACACFALRRAARAATQHYDRALRASGMRITQLAVLAAVGTLGAAPIRELADATAADPTTLTRNLELLRRKGWIRIVRGKRDRRERVVRLTRAGERALTRAGPAWKAAQAEVIASLGPQRARRLRSDLRILAEGRKRGGGERRRASRALPGEQR